MIYVRVFLWCQSGVWQVGLGGALLPGRVYTIDCCHLLAILLVTQTQDSHQNISSMASVVKTFVILRMGPAGVTCPGRTSASRTPPCSTSSRSRGSTCRSRPRWTLTSAANNLSAMFSQSQRRPWLGPSLGWKCLLALSHLRRYDKWV